MSRRARAWREGLRRSLDGFLRGRRSVADNPYFLLGQSSLFDARWYLRQNQDLRATRHGARDHYIQVGWREGRAPGPLFDSAWYTSTFVDAAEADIPPLVHYLRHGAFEGRAINEAGDSLTTRPDFLSPRALRIIEAHNAARQASRAVLAAFEGLGDNCEFGFVQRQAGYENPGLLLFAGTTIEGVCGLLDADFAGIGDTRHLELSSGMPYGRGTDYVVDHRGYGLKFHTSAYLNQPSARVLQFESRRLAYLARKLQDELRKGEKIFVFKSDGGHTERDALRLSAAIARHGPGRLLWVMRGSVRAKAVRVERVSDCVSAVVAPVSAYEDATTVDFPLWLDICTQAFAHGRRDPPALPSSPRR